MLEDLLSSSAAEALVKEAFGIDSAVDLFADHVLEGALRGEGSSRRVVASESQVLSLLKQAAAVITAGGDTTDVEANEKTYHAIADKMWRAQSDGRRLNEASSLHDFFTSLGVVEEIIGQAAAFANVTVDPAVINLAANITTAVLQATASLLASNATSADAAAASSAFLTSVVQVELANNILASQSNSVVQGLLNGSLTVADLDVVVQYQSGANVMALSLQQDANSSSLLLLACGDPTALNYVAGGTGTSLCAYAPSGPPPSAPPEGGVLNNLAQMVGLDVGIVVLIVIVVILAVVAGVFFCYRMRNVKLNDMQARVVELSNEGATRRKSGIDSPVSSPKEVLVEPGTPKSHSLPDNRPDKKAVSVSDVI